MRIVSGLFWVCALAAFGNSAAVTYLTPALLSTTHSPGTMLKKRSKVVKLEFKRSGGFAPITNASGSVTFGDNDAHVSANDGNYQRALAPNEAEALRAAADPSNLSKAGTPPTNRALRDGFQYD